MLILFMFSAFIFFNPTSLLSLYIPSPYTQSSLPHSCERIPVYVASHYKSKGCTCEKGRGWGEPLERILTLLPWLLMLLPFFKILVAGLFIH